MNALGPYPSPGRIVRVALMGATIIFGALGWALGATRLLIAAGMFGVLWTVWDIVWDRLLAPFGGWAGRAFTEGAVGVSSSGTLRPTLDDTIRLLENHLAGRASRQVEIQSALRLEEIYRTVRKNPAKADDIARRILQRYPEAPELERLRRPGAARGGDEVEGE